MFKVHEDSADMEASYNRAEPSIAFVRRGGVPFANLHLSRNSGPIVRGEELRSFARASAIRVTATVLVGADPKATAQDVDDNLSFRFVQLFMLVIQRASYAGRTASNGHMTLDFAGSALFRGYNRFMIDSDPENPEVIPYADHARSLEKVDVVPGLWRAKVVIDDHPHADIPLALNNEQAGGSLNYLYEVAYQFQVITTLVAVNRNTGAKQPLMHLGWGALSSARLPWNENRNGVPEVGVPQFIARYFAVGEPVKGPPTGRGLADMIQNSSEAEPRDTYNAAAREAYRAVMTSNTNNPDYALSARWPAGVPSTHFRR